MVNVFITWIQPNGFTPDHVFLQIKGDGVSLDTQLAGTSTGQMISANSGDRLHIELFNTVNGVDSQHVTIDYTVP